MAFIIVGCSTHPKESEVIAPATHKSQSSAAGIETQQVALEQNAEFVIELVFHKREVVLSQENKNKLQKMMKTALQKEHVDKIKVISWADEEYPSEKVKKLSSEQRQIADDRNKAIKTYIQDGKNDLKIDVYSMAERANSLKEFLGSSEVRIKDSLEHSGIPTSDDPSHFASKASKSIVMFIMK